MNLSEIVLFASEFERDPVVGDCRSGLGALRSAGRSIKSKNLSPQPYLLVKFAALLGRITEERLAEKQ